MIRVLSSDTGMIDSYSVDQHSLVVSIIGFVIGGQKGGFDTWGSMRGASLRLRGQMIVQPC